MITPNKQIILYVSGELTDEDVTELKSNGYLPIAVHDMNNVALLIPSHEHIKGDMLLKSALMASSGHHSNVERQRFGEAMMRHLLQ